MEVVALVAEEHRDLAGFDCNFCFVGVLFAFVSGHLSSLDVSWGVCVCRVSYVIFSKIWCIIGSLLE